MGTNTKKNSTSSQASSTSSIKKPKPIEIQNIIDEYGLGLMEYSFIKDSFKDKGSTNVFFDSDGLTVQDPSLAMRQRNQRWVTFNIPMIDTLSRSNPFVKKAVNYLSSKPLINGIDINVPNNKLTSEQIFDILEYDKNLYPSKKDILSKGYLYGGSAGLLWFDGEEDEDSLKKPLIIKKIKKNSFLGIKPLARWFQVEPALEEELIKEVGGDTGFLDARLIGLPQYYHVSLSGGLSGDSRNSRFIVHASRLLLFNTENPSYIETQIERYWGPSLIELAWNDLVQDRRLWSATTKSAEKNNMGVLKVKGLALAGNMNRSSREKMTKRMEMIKYGSSKNVIPIDSEDDFEFVSAILNGQGEILKINNSRLAGSLKVPVSVLFPNIEADKEDSSYIQSLSELNDLQDRVLREWYKVLIPIITKSLTGINLDKFMFTFNPIETITLKEKAEIGKTNSDTLRNLWDIDFIDLESGIKSLDDLGKDPAMLSQNISEKYREYVKNLADGKEFITSSINQIKISKELNQQKANSQGTSGVESPESGIKGKMLGGNPKEQKNPLKQNVLNPNKGKK